MLIAGPPAHRPKGPRETGPAGLVSRGRVVVSASAGPAEAGAAKLHGEHERHLCERAEIAAQETAQNQLMEGLARGHFLRLLRRKPVNIHRLPSSAVRLKRVLHPPLPVRMKGSPSIWKNFRRASAGSCFCFRWASRRLPRCLLEACSLVRFPSPATRRSHARSQPRPNGGRLLRLLTAWLSRSRRGRPPGTRP